MSEMYKIIFWLALLCMGTASGLTEAEEALEAGLKKYYDIRKSAGNILDEVFYYKINARTAIAIGTGDISNQVLVGITRELKPFRQAINKILDTLQSNPTLLNTCLNNLYRTNMDNATNTAKLVETPRNIAVYYTNKYFKCVNSSVVTINKQLREVSLAEWNLRKRFVENGTASIRACSIGQASGPMITDCIQKYLDLFQAAIDSVRRNFGDFLILDPTFLAVPVLFDCAVVVSEDVGKSAVSIVSALRLCGRRGGINVAKMTSLVLLTFKCPRSTVEIKENPQTTLMSNSKKLHLTGYWTGFESNSTFEADKKDPGLSFPQMYVYLPLQSDYSLNIGKVLAIQSAVSGGKLIIERQIEDARLRLPPVTSSVSDEKTKKALTVFSSDASLDMCIIASQSLLLVPNVSGGPNAKCAQNYLNVIDQLQALYNTTEIELKNTVSDESINIAICITKHIYNLTNEESCGQTLETKLQKLEQQKDELLKSFDRINITAIYACPIVVNASNTVVTVSTKVYDNWMNEIYKCIFD